jgi:transposase
MVRKSRFPYELKIKAVEDYLSGKRSFNQVLNELEIVSSVFETWVLKYRSDGPESLQVCHKNRFYSYELKLNAVKDYLNGIDSLNGICGKYKIKSNTILRRWIKKYNCHETMKSHNLLGEKVMTKGRKTTYEERVEIVSFCIANNDNYQKAIEKFQVSYQQVYTWVNKYKEHGPEALLDNRGRHNKVKELSESEKLDAQLKFLEAENKRLKMENDFLKKLKEIERRR